jgi:parallel beta-helix repeat protein
MLGGTQFGVRWITLCTSVATLLGLLFLPGLPTLARAADKRFVQVVSPGQSIQAAIDQAAARGWVFILPGVYRERADATNGLNINAAINLVGLSTGQQRVVLENSGGQSNGIVAVPRDRNNCMSCHSSLAPPFALKPGVTGHLKMREPMIRDLTIRGISIRNFVNNGLFTENVDRFVIDDVESVGNKNYGIFPTLSKNGVVSHNHVSGSEDAGLWVETSEHVLVTNNVVEGNVIGMEVSNSDDISVNDNECRDNSVGLGVFLLPGLFADHPGAKRINLRNNSVHDNNRANGARPGSLAAELPSGTGIMFLGPDDSEITRNRVWNNDLTGIALVDVCVAFSGGAHDCTADPKVTPKFLVDQETSNTEVTRNVLVNNGSNAASSPFAFAAGDLTLLSFGVGNCFEHNQFTTQFSIIGDLPACP